MWLRMPGIPATNKHAWPARPPPAPQVDVDGNPWPLDAAGNPILK